jgi:Transport and Golgi organisation 2
MCTVSWVREDDGYVLVCNRDERHTRKPALGPTIAELRGVRYIAPVDGDHGGSWIGVNKFGLTLCLLNRYEAALEPVRNEYVSRGLLLTDLLDCTDTKQIECRLSEAQLETFRPFTMLGLGINDSAMVVEWTGLKASIQANAETMCPLISSSYEESRIAEMRQREFKRLVSSAGSVSPAILDRFHRSHKPERGPLSVCMHRDDAATVSMSVITVTSRAIEFCYVAGAPCEEGATEMVSMALR